MKPTRDELLKVRERLEQCVVQSHWDETKRGYLKYLYLAALRSEEYDEKELRNLITGAEIVMGQH